MQHLTHEQYCVSVATSRCMSAAANNTLTLFLEACSRYIWLPKHQSWAASRYRKVLGWVASNTVYMVQPKLVARTPLTMHDGRCLKKRRHTQHANKGFNDYNVDIKIWWRFQVKIRHHFIYKFGTIIEYHFILQVFRMIIYS
jgi:hypothetical protein